LLDLRGPFVQRLGVRGARPARRDDRLEAACEREGPIARQVLGGRGLRTEDEHEWDEEDTCTVHERLLCVLNHQPDIRRWSCLCRFAHAQSCRTTLSRELSTVSVPLSLMNPSLRNLFMETVTCDRVVPAISASVSCETLGSTCRGFRSSP